MRIKKGDQVKVLYGKDAGKIAPVVAVIKNGEYVVVEGVNMYKRHLKGDGQTRISEIVRITKPMPRAKVQLIDPSNGKPTRVSYKVEGDVKVRIGVKSGKPIEQVAKSEKKAKKAKAVKVEDKSKK